MRHTLVSVIVITYNSSKFVLETLESIKAQTYDNIELIITDDCSIDNTINLCSNWLQTNQSRFTKTKLLTIDHNTGVSANLNRGYFATTGDYIKDIAGDDILLPNAISDIVEYLSNNPEVNFAFGKMHSFGTIINSDSSGQNTKESFYSLSAEEQYKEQIINGPCLTAPTFFYRKKAMEELNFCNDETIPMCEDYPKWLRLTKLGNKFYLMNSFIVNYRIHESSLSSTNHSDKYKQASALIFLKYCFKYKFRFKPRQSTFDFLCTKGYLSRNSLYKALRIIFESSDYLCVKLFRAKRINKTGKHYFDY